MSFVYKILTSIYNIASYLAKSLIATAPNGYYILSIAIIISATPFANYCKLHFANTFYI